MRVLVVGGGVLGTMHALLALRRGHQVVQLEREAEARGASVRNFGLIWISGRADGDELTVALRGRAMWEELGREVPVLGFRACGSVTVLRTEAEFAVAEDAVRLDSAPQRNLELLDARRVREVNPALRGDFLGGLWCGRDAVVEPRAAQLGLREHLMSEPGYTWLPSREARDVHVHGSGTPEVRDDHGHDHEADVVLMCPGASLGGLVRELVPDLPVQRVRMQIMQTAALGEPLPTAVADGDSFRRHPAYDSTRLVSIQPQQHIAERHGMQLVMVQRADGGLTIGDTRAYDEPFDFDVEEAPYKHLAGVAQDLLGQKMPKIRRRWAGVYAQATTPGAFAHRARIDSGVWLITGAGGHGMTVAPAVAEATLDLVGL